MKYMEFTPDGAEDCSVRAWIQTGMVLEQRNDKTYPAVLICPGGGYEMISEREGEPVAMLYYAAGYHVFVLRYGVGEKAANFTPLKQAASAMAHIRRHAREWRLEEDHIAVCGFSAGGHLAASLGTLYDDPKFLAAWGRQEDIRPDAMVLSYPVILADAFVHAGSIGRVSGALEGSEEYRYFGLDKHVNPNTPPAFLWHTAEDDCVPVENSLRFAAALSAAKVPFELHVLPAGWHGMSVCTDEVNAPDAYNGRWMEWSVKWLNRQFGYEK